MIITVPPNESTISATNVFAFCKALTMFLDYLHSGYPKIAEQPEIKFDSLILRRFCDYNGYVILGENPKKAQKCRLVATFNENISIKARSPADVEVALRRFALDDKLIVATLNFDARPGFSLPEGSIEFWKEDGNVYVYAEGIAQTAPPRR